MFSLTLRTSIANDCDGMRNGVGTEQNEDRIVWLEISRSARARAACESKTNYNRIGYIKISQFVLSLAIGGYATFDADSISLLELDEITAWAKRKIYRRFQSECEQTNEERNPNKSWETQRFRSFLRLSMLFGGQSIRISALIACNYSKSSSWLNLGFDSHGLDFCSLSQTHTRLHTLPRLETHEL